MATRDDITRELIAGAAPYPLSKKYPKSTVYKIHDELVKSGQISAHGTTVVDGETGEVMEAPLFTPADHTKTLPTTSVVTEERKREAGAETIELGPKTLPLNAVERIRGILGITLRPKVLSCPMPELLYPAMVIAVTELGFQLMRPDDFIDTVLYQWLEACDYIPYAYMKRSEIEEFAKTYGINIEEYAKEHGLMTEEDFAMKHGITLTEIEEVRQEQTETTIGDNMVKVAEDKMVEPVVEKLKDEITQMQKEADDEAKKIGAEPHKPTVGDLLKRLHIDNIKKEVEKNGGTGSTKSIDSQGNHKPGERNEESQNQAG